MFIQYFFLYILLHKSSKYSEVFKMVHCDILELCSMFSINSIQSFNKLQFALYYW